jgi:hypothetical protein
MYTEKKHTYGFSEEELAHNRRLTFDDTPIRTRKDGQGVIQQKEYCYRCLFEIKFDHKRKYPESDKDLTKYCITCEDQMNKNANSRRAAMPDKRTQCTASP